MSDIGARPAKPPKLELIEWLDSVAPGGTVWTDHETTEAQVPGLCYTAGFVMKETRKSITLAGSWSVNQSAGIMCIPKSAIQRRAKLKV